MTEKQRKCIEWICDLLDIDYKGKDNKRDAWQFINKHIEDAKKYRKKIRNDNRTIYGRVYYSENPYSGAYGTDIVDCYDYGIYPWGNS